MEEIGALGAPNPLFLSVFLQFFSGFWLHPLAPQSASPKCRNMHKLWLLGAISLLQGPIFLCVGRFLVISLIFPVQKYVVYVQICAWFCAKICLLGCKIWQFWCKKKCQPGCKNRLCFVVWECREDDAHASTFNDTKERRHSDSFPEPVGTTHGRLIRHDCPSFVRLRGIPREGKVEADFHWLGANTAFTNQRHFHQNTAKDFTRNGRKTLWKFHLFLHTFRHLLRKNGFKNWWKFHPFLHLKGPEIWGAHWGNEGPARTPMGHPPSKRGAWNEEWMGHRMGNTNFYSASAPRLFLARAKK